MSYYNNNKPIPIEEIWNSVLRAAPPDAEVYRRLRAEWDRIAKPLESFGRLERLHRTVGAIQGRIAPDFTRMRLIVCCADHGIVEEGVSQSGQEVTAICAENIGRGVSTAGVLAASCGVDILAVDVGMNHDGPVPGTLYKRIRNGTRNFTRTPAMTEAEFRQALQTGMDLVWESRKQGFTMLGAGEMGIGNTTAAAVLAGHMLRLTAAEVTGRGAGLDDAGLERKRRIIEWALRQDCGESIRAASDERVPDHPEDAEWSDTGRDGAENRPFRDKWRLSEAASGETAPDECVRDHPEDAEWIDTEREAAENWQSRENRTFPEADSGNVTDSGIIRNRYETEKLYCRFGGLELAAMSGMMIGGALYGVPIVLDGMLSMTSALAAERMVPGVRDYLIPSHMSREPACTRIAEELGLEPVLDADMATGEGAGAVLMMSLLQRTDAVYRRARRFEEYGMEPYTRYDSSDGSSGTES